MTSATDAGPAFHQEPNTLCGPHTVLDVEQALEQADMPPGSSAPAWYVVPEQLSIHGSAVWEEISAEDRHRLSRFEAALWASNTIHGEDQVLGGLAPRTELHYFVGVFADEERNHQRMFRQYLTHLDVELLPTRAVGWMTPPLTEPEFFACTYVFEDIVGRSNRAIARDERCHPVARAVNHAHAVEEAVHLNFGRANLARIIPELTAAERQRLADQVGSYLRAVWRERYRSDVYELAGLPKPWAIARQAWSAPKQIAHRIDYTTRALRQLTALGLDPEEIAT